ncbi:MAG: L-glyceraldehyde 3-phosphate reductase, partial [Spirochaetia bacterium]|nr:L-glyceraldehyde 3-phosphate reductase [Spirochaetia bacterium]
KTIEAYEILQDMGVPLLIHQPSYSMINRWVEPELLPALKELGVGTICFSPLAQGMLSDKYLHGIPKESRAGTQGTALSSNMITKENLEKIGALNTIAKNRGQSLAQMALAWVLRREEVTSVLIGASSSSQIKENIASLENLSFSEDELKEIDSFAVDGDINLWAASSKHK